MSTNSIPQTREELLEALKDNPQLRILIKANHLERDRVYADLNRELQDIEIRLMRELEDLLAKQNTATSHE